MIEDFLDRNKIIPADEVAARVRNPDIYDWHIYDDLGQFNIAGWFPPIESAAFQKLVRQVHDGVIVQLGTYEGLSLSYVFDTCRRNHNTVYAIDWYYHPLFEANLMMWGNTDTVIPVTMESTEASGLFEDGSVDFLFIDASHDYEAVRRDFAFWAPKLKPQAILCGHDYAPDVHDGVVQAVNEVVGEGNFAVVHTFWHTHNNPVIVRRAAEYFAEPEA